MSDSEEDYSGTLAFSESEAEEQQSAKVVEVSEKTKKFLHDMSDSEEDIMDVLGDLGLQRL